MKYFENYPFISYPVKTFTIYDVDKDYIPYSTIYEKVIDLHLRINLSNIIKNNVFAVYEYTWSDSDNLTKIALDYYGNYDYAWLILLSGDLFDWIHDLPFSDVELIDYITDKYSITFEQSLITTHHYEDSDHDIIDLDTYTLISEPKYIKTIYDYELEANEKKRKIKLISKAYLRQIVTNMELITSEYKKSLG